MDTLLHTLALTGVSDKKTVKANRRRGARPETVEKYRHAVDLYANTQKSCVEICRECGVTVHGFKGYVSRYCRDLLLTRNGIDCTNEEAASIKISHFQRRYPSTRIKYKDAIEACDSLEYIEYNISQIARMFGLDGLNLGRQLRTHYPGVIERREAERKRLGLDDGLPHGTRPWCAEQYAEAVEMLKSDRYLTLQEVAERCNVSYTGLEQHLVFYHKELVDKRINIRAKAVGQQRKGKITGRGTAHSPKPETVEKYAGALHLFCTTPMSVRQIAKQLGIPNHSLSDYLHTWHKDLVCKRRNLSYKEGDTVDFSKARKYNPATKVKYADAIKKIKKTGLPTAQVAAEFGLHPECLRSYIKEHEPELHARQGMIKTENGKSISRRSMEKYREAIHLYETTSKSLKSIARHFRLNDCSLGQFIKRHFPELVEKRKSQVDGREEKEIGLRNLEKQDIK